MAPAAISTANISTIVRSQYITDARPESPAQIAIPLIVGFILIILIILFTWLIYRRMVKREGEMIVAQKDPSKPRSRYEKELPAETFLLWRQRQCKKLKDPIVFPSDYLCAICISEIADDSIIRGLPCNHCYHKDCLDPWFRRYQYSCPLCKAQFFFPCGHGRGALRNSRAWLNTTIPSLPFENVAVFVA